MARKILMIEDDKDVRLLLERAARRRAWEFHEAATVSEGVSQAKRLKPDLVLLDIQLPDGDGFDVCAALKADPDLAQVPILMVSGKRLSPEEKARGIEIGADDYLAKPFDTSELWLRVEAILRARAA